MASPRLLFSRHWWLLVHTGKTGRAQACHRIVAKAEELAAARATWAGLAASMRMGKRVDLVSANSDQSQEAKPKGRARRFPVLGLLLWAIIAFAIPLVVQPLNLIDVLGFPLGFYMLAQGGLIAFLLIAIVSAWRQDRIDARDGTGD